jgi:hypothetical protein
MSRLTGGEYPSFASAPQLLPQYIWNSLSSAVVIIIGSGSRFLEDRLSNGVGGV